jgi:K+-sensing histidine kinase KdpD
VAAGDVDREPALARNRDGHRAEGIRALLAVPLRINGVDSGSITFYWRERRDFPDAELRAATALANLAGAAIGTAELVEGQGRLRAAAEREAMRSARVQAVTAALSAAASLQQVAATVTEQVAEALGADGAVVTVVNRDGASLEIVGASGLPEDLVARWQRFPISADTVVALAVRSGEPQWPESVAAHLARFPTLSLEYAEAENAGWLSLPLMIEGRAIGGLTLRFAHPHAFDPQEREYALGLAALSAQAVERARLYESSRAAEHRVRAMAEASRSLAAASLSEDAVYQTLVEQATRTLGDGCAVAIVSEDEDHLVVPAVHHADPDALKLLRELVASMSTARPWQQTLAGQVAHTGQAVRRDGLSSGAVRQVVPQELWPYLGRYPIQSLMAVPLGVEGRTFGALVLSRLGDSPPYAAEDQAFAQDLADRAALAIDNAVLYRRAQQAIRARDEFLSIASHELRTPVTALKAVAQLLQRAQARGPLEPDRLQRALQQMDDGSRRLAALTEDLLDVSRLQTGRFELRLEHVDVGSLARQFAEGSVEQLEGRTLVIDTQSGCVVRADPARLEQVLGNLLSNAAKYSPEGGQIEVRVHQDGRGVLLEVEDHGIGLPPGAEEDIFQPFGRGSNAARRQIQGLGLGLYVCREIVQRHDGRIWATSPGEGQGTTLHVWVPTE